MLQRQTARCAIGVSLAFSAIAPAAVAFAQADEAPGTELYLGAPVIFREGSGGAVIPVEGTLTRHLNSWLGISADAGFYGGEIFGEKPLYTFLGGPQLSLRLGRPHLFGHALAGAAYNGCADFSDAAGCLGALAPSGAFGGGIDVRVGDRTSVRAQADLLLTGFRDDTQVFKRLSFGVVFPLGD